MGTNIGWEERGMLKKEWSHDKSKDVNGQFGLPSCEKVGDWGEKENWYEDSWSVAD